MENGQTYILQQQYVYTTLIK